MLTKLVPKRKQETLGKCKTISAFLYLRIEFCFFFIILIFLPGGFLASALFQTLIVTWIKANLNVAVKPELWQSFMELLTRLTHWEDLIKEWAVRTTKALE